MKTILSFKLLLLAQIIFAQTFTEFPPKLPFESVKDSAIATADIDGDNDEDVIITGLNRFGVSIAKLYTNNGEGVYSEMVNTPFDGVYTGDIAFADVDGDNDQDVLIAGLSIDLGRISKLYLNDGLGNFSEMLNTPFEGVSSSAIAFSDIDGDNDQDVIITGRIAFNDPITKLYINDGAGNFSEMTDIPLEEVELGSINFGDINGNGNKELLITGRNGSQMPTAKLYSNDGAGNYTEIPSPFEGFYYSSVAFSDIDGDNDEDVLITGFTNLAKITKLYTNDGVGNFTEVMNTPFVMVDRGSIAFSDIDGDNDEDVLITGAISGGGRTNLYVNDGLGNFSEMIDTPFEGVVHGSISFSDVDDDNDQDVFITGENGISSAISKLYLNNGEGKFTIVGPSFKDVSKSSISFSDVDNDNDQDVLISGFSNSFTITTKLYVNNGVGGFNENKEIFFEGISEGSISFSDIDGDNDQDLLITGKNIVSKPTSNLYINDGDGNFTEEIDIPFVEVLKSSIAFADVDGDNDQDVLITGLDDSDTPILSLYINDSNGNFSEIMNVSFVAVFEGSIAFSDIDGDNDPDVIITGLDNSDTPTSKLYINDGGVFTEILDTPLEAVFKSSISFSDIDGDNDQDVLITGLNNSETPVAKLYLNNGEGIFTEVMDTPLEGVESGSVDFADIDLDNDEDLLITGRNSADMPISILYSNNGEGIFTKVMDTPLDELSNSSIAFADIDDDNYLDLLITGNNYLDIPTVTLYKNTGSMSSIFNLTDGFREHITLYPNPISTNNLSVVYISKENSKININLYDCNGHLISQQPKNARIGEQNFFVNIELLSKGSYFLELDNGKTKNATKFVVQ